MRVRFIAGAVCPQCGGQDTITLHTHPENDHIRCINCGYQAARPTMPSQTGVDSTNQDVIKWKN